MQADDNSRLNAGIGAVRGQIYLGFAEHCNRVTSIAVADPQATESDPAFYEFGWVLGYSSCNGNYYENPRLFIWWDGLNNGYVKHCRVLSAAGASDVFRTMRAGDASGDTVFLAFFDGSVLTNSEVNTNWTWGYLIFSSERSNANDTAFAEAFALEEYRSNGWSSFDNIRQTHHRDPEFHWNRISADHPQVVANP